MIQIIRTTAAGAAVMMFAATAAGCSSGTSTAAAAASPACLAAKEPVALAIGARSNSPMPNNLSAGVDAIVNSAIDANQKVSVVRLDGDPRIVFSQAFDPQGANTQQRKLDYNAYVTSLNQILAGTNQTATDIRAQAPQANVLGALAVAASEVPQGGNVIVLDSGLQTTSPLNFRTGLLSDDPRTIADFLKNAGELPDLKGRHVYFVSLGWTASPQPALDVRNRAKVVQIWEDLARVAGASCVGLDPTADTQDAVPGRPPVAIVAPPPPVMPPGACSVIDLGDANNVGFDFASTKFRDRAGARATLQKIAGIMQRTGESITLTGATSSEGSNQYNLALSLKRAIAVKRVLVQLHIPPGRIKTFGVGAHLPGRLKDRGPNGQLLIGPAIQNRKVVAKLTGAGCRTR